MKKMTEEEFRIFLKEYWADGLTDDEVSIYYQMYIIGRKSVRC